MIKIKLILVLCFILLPCLVRAGADTPAPKKGELYLSWFNYQASQQYDQNRKTSSLFDNGKFSKNELAYFGLHGLNNQTALFFRGTLFSDMNFKSNALNKSNSSLGDQEVGLRRKIKKTSNQLFSLQASFSFPLYSKSGDPLAGNHQSDLDLRALWDIYQKFKLDFISFELAYRKRFEAPADQIKLDFTLGKNIKRFIFMGHAFLTISMKNHDSFDSNSNPNLQADWDNLKIGPSVAYKVKSNSHVQLGLWKDIWGRNIGKGQVVFLSWWQNY